MHPPCHTAPSLAALPGVEHGFFGRPGGVSTGLYASLNTGPGSDDDPRAVGENRRRVAERFGLPADRLLSPYQVHGANVVAVRGPWAAERPQADALVATGPEVALSVLTADCAPILLADAEARVVGAAHAGWKGLLAGVLEAVVARMCEVGARPERLRAAIGPAIAQASYEVGPEFQARFWRDDPASAGFFAPGLGDRLQFDLPGACARRLGALGLASVETLWLDTCALEDDFFSNRRALQRGEADYGRNVSVIRLLPV